MTNMLPAEVGPRRPLRLALHAEEARHPHELVRVRARRDLLDADLIITNMLLLLIYCYH